MWHLSVPGDFCAFSSSLHLMTLPTLLSQCTVSNSPMRLCPLHASQSEGSKTSPFSYSCSTVHWSLHKCRLLFLFVISPIHQMQHISAHFGEILRKLELDISQVSNWFGNKRIRYKKNIVKAQEEANVYAARAACKAANQQQGSAPSPAPSWDGGAYPGGGY